MKIVRVNGGHIGVSDGHKAAASVGRVLAGDVVTIEVAHVGRMSIPVVQGSHGANIVFAKPYEFVRAA